MPSHQVENMLLFKFTNDRQFVHRSDHNRSSGLPADNANTRVRSNNDLKLTFELFLAPRVKLMCLCDFFDEVLNYDTIMYSRITAQRTTAGENFERHLLFNK